MIYTFGRDEIETGIESNIKEPYVLISISTPRGKSSPNAGVLVEDDWGAFLPPDENRLEILRLRFHDCDVWPQGLTDRERAFIQLYSPEQAAQVAAFVRGWQVNFVIHCDAGISRSQGMANAISDHLGAPVRHFRRGFPNSLVYGLTWKALRPGAAAGVRIAWTEPEPEPMRTTVRLTPAKAAIDKYRIRFQG